MALRRQSFEIDEWYHCYNRGIDKRATFKYGHDYERFLQLLYLCNAKEPVHRSNLTARTTKEVMNVPRQAEIVSIGAYCLMPNHFHLLVKEKTIGGITAFMQRLGTAYTMYFNIKHGRIGNLFYKPFRSRHVIDDRYFQRVVEYLHCNPAELFEVNWKQGVVKDMQALEKRISSYRYSSFSDYHEEKPRSERVILSPEGFEIANVRPLRQMLGEARAYYADIAIDEATSKTIKASP
ncbi:MAG: transposase [Parcubacteria group bacterium Gr01-1014_8]|nr:MAG: transposase [Parcubacteria group bacterium Gr01-1014_8]